MNTDGSTAALDSYLAESESHDNCSMCGRPINGKPDIDGHYWTKHARLIAAAPDMHEAITALSERCRVLEEALSVLEWACDQLASTRTHEVYLAMIDSGQADALLSLDARRQAARAALAQKEGK